MSLPTKPCSWSRGDFLVSTDKKLLSIPAINSAFQQDFIYWTNGFPDNILQQIVNNSLCVGLYKSISIDKATSCETNSDVEASLSPNHLEQIGFGRLITDNITFAYLTDLYVIPEYQSQGLGGWMVDCVNELLETLPFLRWAMLRTSGQKSRKSYEKRLGMVVLTSASIKDGPVMMGKKGKGGIV